MKTGCAPGNRPESAVVLTIPRHLAVKVTAVIAGMAVTWAIRGNGVTQRDLTPAYYLS
jgi:hypothetical protein